MSSSTSRSEPACWAASAALIEPAGASSGSARFLLSGPIGFAPFTFDLSGTFDFAKAGEPASARALGSVDGISQGFFCARSSVARLIDC